MRVTELCAAISRC